VGRWEGPRQVTDAWSPQFPQSDRSEIGEYLRDGRSATAYVAEYGVQHQGKELVGYGNTLLNGLRGEVTTNTVFSSRLGPIAHLQVGGNGADASVVAYYYEIGSVRRVNPLAAQLTYALNSMRGPTRSRIVAVRASCRPDCDAAATTAEQLLGDLDSVWAAVE
jgi:EpsI family protein